MKSKTIIGIILAMLPALAVQLGVSFTENDGAMISQAVDLVVQLAGSGLAIYGRWVADVPLSVIED